MAVDTRAERQAAHRVANPWARILPTADGTVAAFDRAHAAGYFGAGGIAGSPLLFNTSNVLGPDPDNRIMGSD